MEKFNTRYNLKKTPIDKLPSMKVLKDRPPELEDEEAHEEYYDLDDDDKKDYRDTLEVKLNNNFEEELYGDWTSQIDEHKKGLVEFTKYGLQLSGEKTVKGKKVRTKYSDTPKKEWKNKYEVGELKSMPVIKETNRRLEKHNNVIYDLLTSDIPTSAEPREFVSLRQTWTAKKPVTRVWTDEDLERINKVNKRLGFDEWK